MGCPNFDAWRGDGRAGGGTGTDGWGRDEIDGRRDDDDDDEDEEEDCMVRRAALAAFTAGGVVGGGGKFGL